MADRRKGKPSEKRLPLATVEQVRLYQKTCYDLNVRHFHEKLAANIGVSGVNAGTP